MITIDEAKTLRPGDEVRVVYLIPFWSDANVRVRVGDTFTVMRSVRAGEEGVYLHPLKTMRVGRWFANFEEIELVSREARVPLHEDEGG